MRTKILTIGLFGLLLTATVASGQTCTKQIIATTPTASFIDNRDGTVTDKRTGLMWMKCPVGLSGEKCTEGRADKFHWALALKEVDEIRGDSGIGNYNDWRMPNVKELRSIVEYSCADPAINLSVFPGLDEMGNKLPFWSSSPSQMKGGKTTWIIWFELGNTSAENYVIERRDRVSDQTSRKDRYYLRLVRDAQ